MRNYISKPYKTLIENTNDPHVQYYMKEELDFIRKIENASNRVFIELGAGYGRVGEQLGGEIKNYIGIEINREMYGGLEQLSRTQQNVETIEGNILHLPKIFHRRKFERPVVMILQNTFGVIEEGDQKSLLESIDEFFKDRQGDLLVSVLKAETLEGTGLSFYETITSMCGNYDAKRSDLENGIFVTDIGYVSKWWKKSEILELLTELKADISEIHEGENFYIFRTTFGSE